MVKELLTQRSSARMSFLIFFQLFQSLMKMERENKRLSDFETSKEISRVRMADIDHIFEYEEHLLNTKGYSMSTRREQNQ